MLTALRHIAPSRSAIVMAAMSLVVIALAVACLFTGSVDIPSDQVIKALTGGEVSKRTWGYIITDVRVPAMVTAALSGAALAVSGLLLQTTFNNPLAGPSILGVTTGASLGVAVALLTAVTVASTQTAAVAGAVVGAIVVIAVLLAMSAIVRSTMMLLIVGIMISYLTSSAISLLNFYSTQEGVHSFVIWGLGSFSGVSADQLAPFATLTLACLAASFLLVKPLDALLLGERYASNLGINVMASRNLILLLSGLLTAVVTAYCGPVSFLGLAVPHIARLALNTSSHRRLLPATILAGMATGLLTQYIAGSAADTGTLPVNAITPLIGVPVVLYIIINRRRINYFN